MRKTIMLSVVLWCINGLWAGPASQVSQWGITWTFDKNYVTGQYANGDYWVMGPVVITALAPAVVEDSFGLHNGWEINAVVNGPQPYDQRIGDFSKSAIPALPCTVQVGRSVVKAISTEPYSNTGCRPCLRTAAVLTVVAAVPPDSGMAVFRPPYVLNEKPLYYVDSLKTGLLPFYAPVTSMPTLASQYESFRRVQLDHQPGRTSTYMRPEDALPFYAANINQESGDAALRLMMNDPLPDKRDLLVAYVQCGIDYFHFLKNGQFWPAGGGEQPGNVLPIVFAATMLDNKEMQDTLRNVAARVGTTGFPYEDRSVRKNRNGVVVWGHWDIIRESVYWDKLEDEAAPGSKTMADPYNYIDGGSTPGDVYQLCCTSQGFKSTVTCLMLMPALRQVWDPVNLIEYVDRWVSHGTWTQPDPCAPVKGLRGVDYGPDTTNPGDCIRDKDSTDGIGRFPALHGTNKDGGLRYSTYAAFMYKNYRFADTTLVRDMPHVARTPVSVLLAPQPYRPAHGEMTLRWAGLHARNADVLLSDRAGRCVRTFALAADNAGTGVRWDGCDAHGVRVVPGIYYLRVQSVARTTVQRVMVLE
jgi:hypothetical protein